jgi:Bacterial Ig-like domain (group 3)/MBG domain (YGX type)
VNKRTAPDGSAALTVTVKDASRTTTQTNPIFSYVVSGALVNNDTYATAVTGTATYATAGGTTPGTFAITVTGLDSANYVLAFLPGTLTVVPTPTTTTLTASPSTPEYGDPITLTATVAPSGATGSVSFFDGSIYLGDGTVAGGVATLTTSTLNAGTHTITAIYNGDATYSSSLSNTVTLPVAKKTGPGPGGAALTVTVQNESREYGTSDPQFVYEVSGTLVNNDTYTTAVTGIPAYSVADTPTSPVGSTFPISISGLSSSNYVVAFVPGVLTITLAPTTTEMAASAVATEYGDPLTFIAMVAPGDATGTVVFSNGSTVLGSGTVTGGFVTLTTSSLNAGTYIITATYLGDNNYGASTSYPVSVTVNKKTGPGPNGAALTVTVGNASRAHGQGNPAFTYTVSGTLVNSDTYQTAVTGVPVYATTAIVISPAGSYPISITGGLNSNNYVIAFVNGTLTVSQGTPALTLASSENPSTYGDSVTFTATLPADATGTVTFLDGTTVLGTGTITAGAATLTTSQLAAGTHPITAQYSGDSNYNAASASLAQVVNPAPSTVALAVPPGGTPIPAGEPVPISGTVPAGETGTITFYDGNTPIGTGTIVNGMVSIEVSTLTPGTHTITAVYSGDANHLPATSPPKTITIAGAVIADFAITNQTPPQIIPPGSSISYTIVLSPVNPPFNGPITLSATNLPPGASFTFTPPMVTTGSSNATTMFTVSVPQTPVASNHGSGGAPLILATLFLPFALFKRWRERSSKLLLWIVVTLGMFSSAIGCGVGGYFSQTQQTYTITVTGTSGNLVHSTTATLTVE